MLSNLAIQPAGNLGPHEYSSRREQILGRIAKIHRLKQNAKTEYAKNAYQKEIAQEIVQLKYLNEQQQAEGQNDNDLELEEVVERGFEIVDIHS